MRRFDDAWVVDRTMFEYLNQGGCSCCGVTHQIMDVAMFADRCSDWESEDEKNEALSPWPSFIHEEILTERARLRVVMKDDMKQYKAFADKHMKGFAAWWKAESDSSKMRVFQAPDDDVMEFFRAHVKVKGSYEIVLCAVMEQLRHFRETRYKDARTAAEAVLESALQHERGCFIVDNVYLTSDAGAANFFDMLQVLGGPKLLPIRETHDTMENNQAEKEVAESVANVQSFRSDRRLVRLVILRMFADSAIRKYRRAIGELQGEDLKDQNDEGNIKDEDVDMSEGEGDDAHENNQSAAH